MERHRVDHRLPARCAGQPPPKIVGGTVPDPEPIPPPALPALWTAATHWPIPPSQVGDPNKVDVYGWPRGTPIRLKIDVHVEGGGAITPLDKPHELHRYSRRPEDGVLVQQWRVTGESTATQGWPRACMEGIALGEMMYILYLRALATGRTYRILHVLKDAPRGQDVRAGGIVGYVGDSGIVGLCAACGFDCNPAHMHVEGDGMTGLQACQELGLTISTLVARIPSPQEYQQCKAIAGRFR